MSAAKMVADSTQSDTDSRKRRNRSSGRSDKKSRKDRRRRRYSTSSGNSTDSRRSRSSRSDSRSDDYDSDIDLQKELKPLDQYLRKPGDLLDQMLHSVRGSSLQRALPEALKDMPMDELRKRCLEHLEVMSKKRMKRILAGDDPATISSSGTDEDDSTDEEKEPGERASQVDSTAEGSKADSIHGSGGGASGGAPGPADSPLSIAAAEDIDDQGLLLSSDTTPQRSSSSTTTTTTATRHDRDADDSETAADQDSVRRTPRDSLATTPREGSSEGVEIVEVGDNDEEEDDDDDEWEVDGGPGEVADVLFPDVEQDKMELLELEMRARAIKAMLVLHEQREKESKRRVKKK